MHYLLSIETALDVCSVAISKGEDTLAIKEESGHNIHSAKLTIFIEDICKESGISLSELGAIAVSKGPGSYTGLRIGVSVAKGLAYSLDKPLIAINTLESLCFISSKAVNNKNALYCPMIDARRMEVFCGLYSSECEEVSPTVASIIDEKFIHSLPADKDIFFFGNGMQKCREILSALPNAFFIEGINPSASAIAVLGHRKYLASAFENVSSFEPFYLKDFFTNAKI